MKAFENLSREIHKRQTHFAYNNLWQRLHLDPTLLLCLSILIAYGLIILYSAANQNLHLVSQQLTRLGIAACIMLVLAQIPPQRYRSWSPWVYIGSLGLLAAVLIAGKTGKGAQRWLDLHFFRFQPSELMKIALPLMIARYFDNKTLPPKTLAVFFAGILFIIPSFLIAKQPDLGTALIIMGVGGGILLVAGINWGLVFSLLIAAAASLPVLWHYMHDYQRQRVLTFLNPERDPLGHGYHIIQSKIAICSGGIYGKGWLEGTQSHLHFLPEHATDFIFAVCGEEFGLVGSIILLTLYLLITLRALYIASIARETYTRLLAASIGLTFFISAFVNIGMVTGVLPVVGLPLPLVSYGGTSIVTIMAGFGIIMSIHTHRKLYQFQ